MAQRKAGELACPDLADGYAGWGEAGRASAGTASMMSVRAWTASGSTTPSGTTRSGPGRGTQRLSHGASRLSVPSGGQMVAASSPPGQPAPRRTTNGIPDSRGRSGGPGPRLPGRLAQLGDMTRRTEMDFVTAFGLQPTSISTIANGQRLLQWQVSGQHLAVLFTADHRFARITHRHCV